MAYGAVWEVYDFGQFSRLVDVGGGQGQMLAPILAANRDLEGALFDVPTLADRAGLILSEAGVAKLCHLVGGNFFDSIPAGGDAYLPANIVHDWDDESAVRILRNCRRVMTKDATILLVEGMLSEWQKGSFSRLSDVAALALTPGGRLRTREEYAFIARKSQISAHSSAARGSGGHHRSRFRQHGRSCILTYHKEKS